MSEPSTVLIRIALVEAEPAARLGLSCYLRQFPRLRISLEIESASRGDALFGQAAPDLALIDTESDGGGGLQLIRRAHHGPPRFPCVAWIRRSHSPNVLNAIRAGALGVVCRCEPLSETVLALLAAYIGYTHLSPIAATALGDGLRCEEGFSAPNPHLPGRQLQVFRMLGDGMTALDVARRMGISPKTVHTHIERLKQRLNCPNQAALCRLAAVELAREE